MSIKKQETRLTLQEHDDDDDDEKFSLLQYLYFKLSISEIRKNFSTFFYLMREGVRAVLVLRAVNFNDQSN